MININRKNYLYLIGLSILVIAFTTIAIPKDKKELNTSKLNAIIINANSNEITVQDDKNIIYTFDVEENQYKAGENVIIEYTGLLDKSTEIQTINLVGIKPVSQDEEIFVRTNNNMFDQFNILASNKLKTMTLDEKIGQILLVRYTDETARDAINKYKVGGFIFFENDFKDKTISEVQSMIKKVQELTSIPLLTAVDEEGGEVVRISSNKNLVSEPFLSPRQLYLKGGFDLIKEDTINKSKLLESLGLNVNLAPVVDVSTTSSDYIYTRTLGEDTKLVSEYAKTVIEASKDSSISYVLKHFPGYGNNEDTHEQKVIDKRSFSEIEKKDLPPFEAGIKSNAEAILVNHNIVESIDENNPASLSASIHNLLRNNLGFTGIIITDDLSMGATSSIDNVAVKAILAGNDIIITTDFEESFNQIKKAVTDGMVDEEYIDNIVHRILSWKYYKGLMYEKQK